MKISQSGRLYGLGTVLLVALFACSRHLSETGERAFLIPLAVAGLAYLLAIREFFATPKLPRHAVIAGLVLAAVWHFQFLRMPPGPDDDIHRYLWDGHLQRLGYNPYVVVPNDPAFARLHLPETRTLNNPDVPSPYPAGAQVFFRAVTAIHESIFALKVAFVLCDFAIAILLLHTLRRNDQGLHWVLAYAWNPLLATTVAGSGHIDIVGALLLLVSFAALDRRWRTIAAVALGLAVAVKFLPIVLLPLYWKRIRIRDAALAAALVGLLYLPFLKHGSYGGVTLGHLALGSLPTYVRTFRFNDPVFAMLERVASPQLIAGLAVLVGFFTAAWIRRRSLEPSPAPDDFAWPMAASLFCAPVVYPWYLLWLLPFLRSVHTLPLMIWTISIIPTCYVWHLRTLGRPWVVPGWILLLEYGSVALTVAIIGLRTESTKLTAQIDAKSANWR